MTTRETRRQRSTNYPSMDLAWAEDIIRKAYNSGTTNRIALAQLIGHQDDTSGPARSKLAALRHFRLVDYEEGNVVFTELGKKVAAPMPGEDVSEALRQSFFNVAAFKQMYELCAKDVPLPKDVLGNTAIRQIGIIAKVASEFVDIFTSSGVRVQLVELVDEKSLKILPTPTVIKQALGQKPGEVTSPSISIPKERTGEAQAWNISLTIDSSMDPTKLRELIKVLKEEL